MKKLALGVMLGLLIILLIPSSSFASSGQDFIISEYSQGQLTQITVTSVAPALANYSKVVEVISNGQVIYSDPFTTNANITLTQQLYSFTVEILIQGAVVQSQTFYTPSANGITPAVQSAETDAVLAGILILAMLVNYKLVLNAARKEGKVGPGVYKEDSSSDDSSEAIRLLKLPIESKEEAEFALKLNEYFIRRGMVFSDKDYMLHDDNNSAQKDSQSEPKRR